MTKKAFIGNLPQRPYCTDDTSSGLLIRPQATALAYRHIQYNPPPHVASLVFDLDKPDSYHAWQDAGLPAPHWISVNRTNGHAHIGYMLATPVARTSAARQKPLRYLAAIEHVLAKRLGADMGYSGLITKNPTHSDWLTVWHQIEPYSLDYLAEFCPDADLAAYSRRSRKEVGGLGRNVTVFDNVREWAYSSVRAYWRPNGYEAWADAVRSACESANAFGREQGGPLPVSEIKATAKSIARWVWRNLTPSTFADYVVRTHTTEIQAARGAKGGKVSKRPTKGGMSKAELLPEVIRLKALGYSNRDIGEDLGI
ncbi:replication initiation protein, partial [Escherichia coli]|nr:replication initiation protein [Escherichia coli]